ncbi:primosomal protein N' [candidate division WOR-3 bacterium]|nr:primosomal protein N' [candidate division WOR-3 bacterium]
MPIFAEKTRGLGFILTSSTVKYLDVFVPNRKIILTYLHHGETRPVIGRLVQIHLKNEASPGCVIGETKKPENFSVKPIDGFIGDEIFLDEKILSIAQFMNSYYGYPLEACLVKTFPSGLFSVLKKTVSVSVLPDYFSQKSNAFLQLSRRKKVNFDHFLENIRKERNLELLGEALDKNHAVIKFEIPSQNSEKTAAERLISVQKVSGQLMTEFQKTIFNFVVSSGNSCELSKITSSFPQNAISEVAKMVRKNILKSKKTFYSPGIAEKFTLTQEQNKCAESVGSNPGKVFLLKGVTGSGKTMVYHSCIEDTLRKGKSVLFLVPEIALIPQTKLFFQKHLNKVETLTYHSGMKQAMRFEVFRKTRDTSPLLVIGTRSSIFLPMKNIGLMVVDEEHSQHYKEEDSGPFYSARDLAVWQSQKFNFTVILGSATPSAESFLNAKKGKYNLLSLPNRATNTKMPECFLLPVSRSKCEAVSKDMKDQILENYNRNEQSILLINRRGFSNYMVCPHCLSVVKCPSCNVSMTYHESEKKLVCHYCGKKLKIPEKCPVCAHPKMHFHGAGTEKVEHAISKAFPEIEILRLDTDVLRKSKQDHEKFFSDFHSGRYPILVGTQMVSKGLDFPGVTLVGIIDADSALAFPDFRAAEIAFQLIVQTSGRAGRAGQKSKVLIQTENPSNPLLVLAQNHDYEGFIEKELRLRREVGYPPFTRLARIVVNSTSNSLARKTSFVVKNILENSLNFAETLGPVPCPIEKIRNRYRWHLLVKAPKNILLGRKILDSGIWEVKTKAKIYVDIDPFRML